MLSYGFDNSYARLPERFFARLKPRRFATPSLVKLNGGLARMLNLDPALLSTAEGVEVLAGNRVAEGSEPLAMAYAGHQFGHFVPVLGDGRTNLLGEVIGRDGARYDLQLKGSGVTPFSRRGDGKAALGPVLREYILSEAMAALGVPTTRALAAVTTGEKVYRETVQPGAVFVRVAASHLRVGTFQYFAAKGDLDGLRVLADYAIQRHYSPAAETTAPYRELLHGVIERHAELVARWMLLGFIHGIMNTDNTSISGETIDYGPCAFLDAYDPQKVFSSIDSQGRYAYGNQPNAAHWNLSRFAETLLPLLAEEAGSQDAGLAWAYEELAQFGPKYEAAYLAGMNRKLGLFTLSEGDAALAQRLLDLMAASEADFTSTFRKLCDAALGDDGTVQKLFSQPEAFDVWAAEWRGRLGQETVGSEERAAAMRRASPLYVPRNHLVAEALAAAVERGDFSPFEELLEVVLHPFEEVAGREKFTEPAEAHQRVAATFCGT